MVRNEKLTKLVITAALALVIHIFFASDGFCPSSSSDSAEDDSTSKKSLSAVRSQRDKEYIKLLETQLEQVREAASLLGRHWSLDRVDRAEATKRISIRAKETRRFRRMCDERERMEVLWVEESHRRRRESLILKQVQFMEYLAAMQGTQISSPGMPQQLRTFPGNGVRRDPANRTGVQSSDSANGFVAEFVSSGGETAEVPRNVREEARVWTTSARESESTFSLRKTHCRPSESNVVSRPFSPTRQEQVAGIKTTYNGRSNAFPQDDTHYRPAASDIVGRLFAPTRQEQTPYRSTTCEQYDPGLRSRARASQEIGLCHRACGNVGVAGRPPHAADVRRSFIVINSRGEAGYREALARQQKVAAIAHTQRLQRSNSVAPKPMIPPSRYADPTFSSQRQSVVQVRQKGERSNSVGGGRSPNHDRRL